MNSSFKKRLIELRKNKDISQEKFAELIGVSKSAISMYENGNRTPDFETEEKIADFFNVDLDYLRGRSDISNKNHSRTKNNLSDEFKSDKSTEEKEKYNLTPSELAEFEKLKNMQTSLFLFNDKQLSVDAMEKFEQALLEAFIDTIKQRKGDTNK